MRTNWPLILTLWLAGLLAAAQFGKVSVTFDLLTGRYGGGIALMVSIVGLVGLILGTTAGILTRRIGPTRVLIAALALGAVISGVQALPLPFGVMMLTRVAEGVSHLGIVVTAPVLIARVAAPAQMGAAMSLWSSFFGVSFALTAWLGLPLAEAQGVNALFALHGVLMAALAVVLIRMAPRIASDQLPLGNLFARHVEIYRSPRIAAPALGFVFYTALYVALLTLLPQLRGSAEKTVLATGMPLISIAVSLTLGVWLLRHFDPVRLVQAGFVSAAGAALWMALTWSGSVVAPGLLLAGALGLVQGASFASIPRLNPDDAGRALAAGAIAQMGNLGTTSGTPVLELMTQSWGLAGLLLFILPLTAGGIVVPELLRRRRATEARSSDI